MKSIPSNAAFVRGRLLTQLNYIFHGSIIYYVREHNYETGKWCEKSEFNEIKQEYEARGYSVRLVNMDNEKIKLIEQIKEIEDKLGIESTLQHHFNSEFLES